MGEVSTQGTRRHDARRLLAAGLAVLFCVTLFGGLLSSWTDQAVFDRTTFADRGVRLLESSAVRQELAKETSQAIIQNGPSQLAGFRTVIQPALEDLMTTPAFKDIFRTALEQAHRSLFTEGGNTLAVNLSQSLGVLASSLQISNPDVASNLPTGVDTLLVDFGDNIRALELWKTAEDFDQLAIGLLTSSAMLAVAVIAIDRRPRRGVFKVGIAVTVSGVLLVAVALIVPRAASSAIGDPSLQAALRSALGIFVADLQTLGVWVIGYGVVAAALATASTPSHEAYDARVLGLAIWERWQAWQPTSPSGRVVRPVLVIAAGIFLIVQRDVVLPLAVAVGGAYVAYLGVVQLLSVVGRTTADKILARAGTDPERREREKRTAAVLVVAAVLVGLISVAGLVATGVARSRAAEAAERRCNGSTELCDRTIDRVAFPGAHNAMSAASEPGWLFPENTNGIGPQLEFGVRALLVKTHYGVPTGITFTGADLVVTDRAAEIAVNPQVAEDQLPTGSVGNEQALQLAASARIDPAKRNVYLCHVYCEYGATLFTDALSSIKRFIDRNPHEVVILFVGNYVSTEDTQKAFEQVGLLDRLYSYDPTRPPPTLGELVDARQNIFMLSEFSGPPPSWNNLGYGLFQDTPFTFTDTRQLMVPGSGDPLPGTTLDTTPVDDTVITDDTALSTGTTLAFGSNWTGVASCAPNRGSPDSPLFQINHFVTPAGAAPTVAQAATVNAYDVLMPRVQSCMAERNHFPTIIGVNYYDTGDLLKVVDELNEVD
ncbi:MAG TPA: hypothetical protein VIY72_07130 [Acidimicrobiales bacterium]